jgi:hypothetical protein
MLAAQIPSVKLQKVKRAKHGTGERAVAAADARRYHAETSLF